MPFQDFDSTNQIPRQGRKVLGTMKMTLDMDQMRTKYAHHKCNRIAVLDKKIIILYNPKGDHPLQEVVGARKGIPVGQ